MRNDDLYLQDISDACGSILAYLADVEKVTFLEIEMMQSAVILKFIVIGEAASNISSEVRDEHPEIDWKTLKLFRNFLVHVYFSTTIEKVWEAGQDVVNLKEHIDAVLRFRKRESEDR